MLSITIPEVELWDEVNHEFINIEGGTLQLEHSLASLYDWESKWHKPFLSKEPHSYEETMDYVRCMILNKDANQELCKYLTSQNIEEINKYIEDPMTATWFSKDRTAPANKSVITAEIIYYWMVTLNIPQECQYWHLNRLMTFIRVCNEKNKPPKKMSKKDLLDRHRIINEARRKQAKKG